MKEPTLDEVSALQPLVEELSPSIYSTSYGFVNDQGEKGMVVTLFSDAAKDMFDKRLKELPETHPLRSVRLLTESIELAKALRMLF